MRRTIVGFHCDAEGDWVAELSCLHNQHVRHRPPFQEREWATTEAGRSSRIGSEIECPLCDRAELPDGLHLARTAGPFDGHSLPEGLRRDHRVADRTWGVVRVLDGSVTVELATEPPITATLVTGENQPLPPAVPHHLRVDGPVIVAVDFMVPANGV